MSIMKDNTTTTGKTGLSNIELEKISERFQANNLGMKIKLDSHFFTSLCK